MTTQIELTEAEQSRRGELIAQTLKLKRDRDFQKRYVTAWGTKSDIGIYLTVKRLIEDGE